MEMEIPITQSKAWKNLQDDLNEESIFIETESYQYLGIIKDTPVGKYLYCPYGPVANDPDSFKQALNSLIEYAKSNHLIFVRIEPFNKNYQKQLPKNAIKSKDLNPKETWILDLSGSEDELKARLPSRLLRYYKSSENKGIKIKTSNNPDDIHYLLELQRALAQKKGINTFSEEYLKTELSQPFATLYLVFHEESEPTLVAAGLVFDDMTTRYNLQGAQSEQGRKLHATGILTIRLILDAKAKGLKKFDFWGIAPENAPSDHPWKGFTDFKKTFAGQEVDHAGTYDIIIKPTKYRIYQLARKINQKRKNR